MVREKINKHTMKLNLEKSKFTRVSSIKIPAAFYNRMRTGVKELDEMFGEGILPGGVITIAGLPGTGKSSFLAQLMEALTQAGYEAGYTSGEESQFQMAYNFKRLNATNVSIANETDIDTLAEMMVDLDVLVIDSFQALTSEVKMNHSELERYAIEKLCVSAKENDCALIFVLHSTKSGGYRGGSLIPHAVDVNMHIATDEDAGDESLRIITIHKNRYGACGSYNAYMTSSGFELSGKRVMETKAPSKKSRQKELIDSIMKLDPPNITKALLMEKFELTGSQAYFILKELVDNGTLIKMGRGVNSVWKKTLVTALKPAIA